MSYFARLHGKNYSISVILFQIQLMRQVKFIIILLHTSHDCSAFIKLEDKLPKTSVKAACTHDGAKSERRPQCTGERNMAGAR